MADGKVLVAAFFLSAAAVSVAHAEVASCRVFLIPGAFGAGASSLFLKKEAYFSEYREFFKAKGCVIQSAEFPADATIEERALILKDQLGRFSVEKSKLVLIAHSQGALDARFALRTLGLPPVHSLISIGAPHSGTPIAQWTVRHRTEGSMLYWALRLVGYDLRALSFAGEVTPEFLQTHQTRFERLPRVHYASAQGVCKTHCHWILMWLGAWVGVAGDGLIDRESQRLGDDLGEYNLDHISEVDSDSQKRPERLRFLNAVWTYISSN